MPPRAKRPAAAPRQRMRARATGNAPPIRDVIVISDDDDDDMLPSAAKRPARLRNAHPQPRGEKDATVPEDPSPDAQLVAEQASRARVEEVRQCVRLGAYSGKPHGFWP